MRIIKLTILILFLCLVSGFSLFFFKTPPLLEGLSFSTAVFDDNKQLLRITLNKEDKFRLFTPLAKIPDELISATLLQEDQYFRWHFGVNPLALIHAAYQTYLLQTRRFG